ncbi:hypothetical protein CG716_05455 [Mycolicibacterium sphagni]|uniref:Uncharacterized protein n=1 Tax=Mycolicibacterium sphagni TaxID=1786 RepID=A0A255DQR4_9MYCO|nr:hypothetical protein CG716_05455 [Mycolicibacterium sphagni]
MGELKMIERLAGPPEVRCILCGAPAGWGDGHPNVKHSLYVGLAALEYRIERLTRAVKAAVCR